MARDGGYQLPQHQQRPGDTALSSIGPLRNVRIGERRTSIRLEPEMWEALGEICANTGKDVNEICTEVYRANMGRGNFTSGLRVFIVEYFRSLASQDGAARPS